MKPYKISLFLLSCLSGLYGLLYVSESSEKDGYRTETGFTIASKFIKYPTKSAFFAAPKIAQTNDRVQNIVSNIGKTVLPENAIPDPTGLSKDGVKATPEGSNSARIKEQKDTLSFPSVQHPKTTHTPVIPDLSKIDSTKVVRLQYPEDRESFKEALLEKLEGPRCRILHYGDSQLEGDRISGYLRNRLQLLYGGEGPGFISIKQPYDEIKAEVTHSDNWLRFAVIDPASRTAGLEHFGVFTSYSRFTPHHADSASADSLEGEADKVVKAFIEIAPGKLAFKKSRSFSKVVLHYGRVSVPISYTVLADEVLFGQGRLSGEGYNVLEIPVSSGTQKVRIELEGVESADFYGLTLEGSEGIQLDNVAMRGASGTEFVRMDRSHFRSMASRLKPSVFIFQYGGNSLPYLKDSTGVEQYVRYVKANLNWVRRSAPEAVSIFVGPSDMSYPAEGSFRTYPLLPYLDSCLQKACLESGVAYWSMYEAMGGNGAMPQWVEQGLAQQDYTHFTSKGSAIISELLFTAIYLDLL